MFNHHVSFKTIPGTKIVYANCSCGYPLDRILAAKYLELNGRYTLKSLFIGGYHATVTLTELPGISFNLMLFDDDKKDFECSKLGVTLFSVHATTAEEAYKLAFQELGMSVLVKND